jgi:hypothetical protein
VEILSLFEGCRLEFKKISYGSAGLRSVVSWNIGSLTPGIKAVVLLQLSALYGQEYVGSGTDYTHACPTF